VDSFLQIALFFNTNYKDPIAPTSFGTTTMIDLIKFTVNNFVYKQVLVQPKVKDGYEQLSTENVLEY